MAFTEAKAWKKSKVVEPSDLELPSGHVALVRAPGMEVFIQLGYIPNSLLGMINKITQANDGNAVKAKSAEDKVMSDLLGDPEKVQDMFTMVDRIALHCVVQPPLHEAPENDEDRDSDLLYVDEVDFGDKMFIMNFAMGGTRAVEQFRGQVAGVLEPGDSGKKPVKKTKRTGGAKKKSGSKKSRG